MNVIVPAPVVTLPALVDRAVLALSNARTAAEVLEARDMASVAYDAAKKAARLGKAKKAHDDLVAAAYRAQADALAIESEAKRRLADEYDAAQDRGEIKVNGGDRRSPKRIDVPSAADVGLSTKEVFEAREIRDAEKADPGIVRRLLDEAIEAGEEPTKAKVRRAVKKASARGKRKAGVRYSHAPISVDPEPRHDVDLRRLEVAWEAACETARVAFMDNLGYSQTEPAS